MASPESDTNPKREPELNLLAVQDRMDVSLWQSLRANLRDLFLPRRQAPLQLTSRPISQRDAAGNHDVVGAKQLRRFPAGIFGAQPVGNAVPA